MGAIFARLASADEAGATIRLSTGFGGGKTHTLIVLWHLARNIADPALGTGAVARRRPAGAQARLQQAQPAAPRAAGLLVAVNLTPRPPFAAFRAGSSPKRKGETRLPSPRRGGAGGEVKTAKALAHEFYQRLMVDVFKEANSRFKRALVLLGGFPQWPPEEVAAINEFVGQLTGSQGNGRVLLGSELEAALNDPRWQAAARL